jgi:hypothetical protein
VKNLFRASLAVVVLFLPTLSLTCSAAPLCCGKLSVMVKGGVTPTSYSDRQPFFNNYPDPGPGIIESALATRFSNQFSVPWNIGAEVAWNAGCRIQYFVEYSYTQASGKTFFSDRSGVPITQRFIDEYRTHAGYLGSRYYFSRESLFCFGQIAPYVGLKVGLAAQERVRFEQVIRGIAQGAAQPYFLSQKAVSGGVQVGLEWWACRCLSVVLQGEFVGTCGFKPNRNVVVNPSLSGGIANMNVGSTGWVLNWPITLGLRYSF